MFNRRVNGLGFDQSTIDAVWRKGTPVPNNDPNLWRKDACGAFMYKPAYGDTNAAYGWEIDHIKPRAKEGTDDLSNLQPLFWKNNRAKGDDFPSWSCKYAA